MYPRYVAIIISYGVNKDGLKKKISQLRSNSETEKGRAILFRRHTVLTSYTLL